MDANLPLQAASFPWLSLIVLLPAAGALVMPLLPGDGSDPKGPRTLALDVVDRFSERIRAGELGAGGNTGDGAAERADAGPAECVFQQRRVCAGGEFVGRYRAEYFARTVAAEY